MNEELTLKQSNIHLGDCPDCKKSIIDKGMLYGCTGYPGCYFAIGKELYGINVTVTLARQLLTYGHSMERLSLQIVDKDTGEISQVESYLVLYKPSHSTKVGARKYLDIGPCPKCKTGTIIEFDKVFKCNNRSCGTYAYKNYWEVTIDANQMKRLIGRPGHIVVSKETKSKHTRRVKLTFEDLFK